MKYFIRNKYHGWYREGANGYTTNPLFAGLFTKEEALKTESEHSELCEAVPADKAANYCAGIIHIVKRNLRAMDQLKTQVD